MQPSTVSWANLVKSKPSINISSWPTVNLTNNSETKNKITLKNIIVPSENENAVNIIKEFQDLKLSDKTVNQSTKTREEIILERKQRKKAAKEFKNQLKLEEKVKQTRAPKSQKVQLIDSKFLEIYNNSTRTNENVTKPISTTKNRIKQKLKQKNVITVNLAELIENKLKQSKGLDSVEKRRGAINGTKLGVLTRHKGKKREFPKPKLLTHLKRNIILIRKLRKELRERIENSDCIEQTQATNRIHSTEEEPVDKPKLTSESEQKTNLNPETLIQFSRKFRPYCDHFITPELCENVKNLLSDIFRFQKRAYEKNEIKGRAKRRYIVGFREIQRNLELKKIKLLIIAPDLEPNTGTNGLDDSVDSLKITSKRLEIPYVFSLPRRKLGYLLFKKVPVSCIGIINYEGSDENFKNILSLVEIERANFEKKLKNF